MLALIALTMAMAIISPPCHQGHPSALAGIDGKTVGDMVSIEGGLRGSTSPPGRSLGERSRSSFPTA
jgi:hypothetical protein